LFYGWNHTNQAPVFVGVVYDFKFPKYSAMRIELNRVAVTLD
jgi:hypothetical protein